MSALLASYAPERAFLGVTRSVTGRTWRDRCGLREGQTALAIAQRYALADVLARVIASHVVAFRSTGSRIFSIRASAG
jgi:single-stranded-DNA-specific exonuclease